MNTKCWIVEFADDCHNDVYTDYAAACNAVKDFYLAHIAEWIENIDGDIVKKDLIHDMETLQCPFPYIEDTVYMYEAVLVK